jgi:hypothetical protein
VGEKNDGDFSFNMLDALSSHISFWQFVATSCFSPSLHLVLCNFINFVFGKVCFHVYFLFYFI